MSSLEILRRRVAVLLRRSGRNRKELAEALGKSPSWSTEFFSGKHGVSMNDLDMLARFFGVSVASLLADDPDDRRHGDRRKGEDRRKIPPA